jgi:hypothetical protein
MTHLPTVAVCGFGRCGSSMLMAILAAGGVPAVDGSDARSGELDGGIEAAALLSPDQLGGHAVKLLDAVLHADVPLPAPPAGWLVLWMDRDGREQARSQVKLLRGVGIPVPSSAARDLEASYRRDRGRALQLLADLGPVWTSSYEAALADPGRFAGDLAEFLAPALTLDVDSAAARIHRRPARCAPGLAFEHGADPPT